MARKNPFPMTREARRMWNLAKASRDACAALWAFDKAHDLKWGDDDKDLTPAQEREREPLLAASRAADEAERKAAEAIYARVRQAGDRAAIKDLMALAIASDSHPRGRVETCALVLHLAGYRDLSAWRHA